MKKYKGYLLVYVVVRIPGGHPEDAFEVVGAFESEPVAQRFCEWKRHNNSLDPEADERGVSRGQYVVHPTVFNRRKRGW